VNAVCRTGCTSDVDCCPGTSGTVCRMGVCITANEAAPQCLTNVGCGPGQSCTDAICE
jgi:hypothetical protein